MILTSSTWMFKDAKLSKISDRMPDAAWMPADEE